MRRSLISRGSRVRDSVKGDGDSTSLLSSATDEDCASVALDPLEHEWMLCASDGLWDSLQPLLAVEPGLVTKRDFVTGFTCLHWAAKQGKAELLSQLLAFAKENAIPVNLNVRSSAGYTPLHLAAMHGHTQVGGHGGMCYYVLIITLCVSVDSHSSRSYCSYPRLHLCVQLDLKKPLAC